MNLKTIRSKTHLTLTKSLAQPTHPPFPLRPKSVNSVRPRGTFTGVEPLSRLVVPGLEGISDEESDEALEHGERAQLADSAILDVVPLDRYGDDVESGVGEYALGSGLPGWRFYSQI